MRVKGIFEVWRYYARDLVTRCAPVIAIVIYIASHLFGMLGQRVLQLNYLLLSNRLYPNRWVAKSIKKRLPSLQVHLGKLVSNGVSLSDATARSIVLKEPTFDGASLSSKGVLLITFTITFSFFFRRIDVARLLEYYHVVLEPSSSGYSDPDILFWAFYTDAVIVQATEAKDRQFLHQLGSNLKPVSFGASDWVDYRVFRPLNVEKQYDSVYVANLALVKRIHIYLRAIRNIHRLGIEFKAALVTAGWGGQQERLDNLLEYYGVKGCIKCFQSLRPGEINKVLNQSKVSMLLSLKEGANRTLYESIFADTPVVALENNMGINKEYINKYTGLLIKESQLENTLLYFKSLESSFEPRKWAMENISPEVTTCKVVDAINKYAWQQDAKLSQIAVKVNAPEVSYMHPDALNKFPRIGEVLKKFAREEIDGF